MTDADAIVVTYDPTRGYVAALPGGSSVHALSLATLRQRLPNVRLILDRKAKAERALRARGGHGGGQQWRRT